MISASRITGTLARPKETGAGCAIPPTGRPSEALVEVGRSTEGRPILARRTAPSASEGLRVLIVAGQHGDEPWARDAARLFADDFFASAGPMDRSGIGLVVIPEVNPDGAARHSRRNAQGIDLNRDHLGLVAAETAALHRFVREYRPHLVVDVHNYPARRRHLLAQGWTIDADVQYAVPTHPAARTSLDGRAFDDLTAHVAERVRARGFSVSPYTLFRRSGRARPSTLRTRDLRNGLALRYGVPTVLLEGRDPGRRAAASDLARTTGAERAALHAVVEWARAHADLLTRGPPVPVPGEPISIDGRWRDGGTAPLVPLRRESSGRVTAVAWSRYSGERSTSMSVELPRAYAVRADLRGVLELLDRHELSGDEAVVPRSALVTRASGPAGSALGTASSPGTGAAPYASDLNGYRTFSVHQRGGRALAVWLEPQSRFGIAEAGLLPPGTDAPERPAILRVLRWDYPGTSPVAPFGRSPASGSGDERDPEEIDWSRLRADPPELR